MTTSVAATPALARLRATVPRRWRELARRITRWRPPRNSAGERPAPTGAPFDHPTEHVAPAATAYERNATVWTYIGGAWRRACVAATTGNIALVTYRLPGDDGQLVEPVPVFHLVSRDPNRPGATPITRDEAVAEQARAILLVHHADADGMCQGCGDLAHYCWAPCPKARDAMRVLGELLPGPAGAR